MELSEVLRRRRMVRNFEARVIAPDVLQRVLAAARRAPAAGNTDAIDLLVVQGEATSRYWDTTLKAPRRGSFRWPGLLRAPVLVIVCTSATSYVDRYGESDKRASGLGAGPDAWPVPYWHVDAGMASMAMLLTAVDEGLGALFFGLFGHEESVRAEFAIPAGHQPVGTIALGYPADDEAGRSADRPRRPDDEVVHLGGW